MEMNIKVKLKTHQKLKNALDSHGPP